MEAFFPEVSKFYRNLNISRAYFLPPREALHYFIYEIYKEAASFASRLSFKGKV